MGGERERESGREGWREIKVGGNESERLKRETPLLRRSRMQPSTTAVHRRGVQRCGNVAVAVGGPIAGPEDPVDPRKRVCQVLREKGRARARARERESERRFLGAG